MIRGISGSRGLAAFVVAFLCLNVAGALCLSWCLQMPMAHAAGSDDGHLSEHCRSMKLQAEQANEDASRVAAGEAACCMMPVVLFAAPVEKRVELAKFVVVADRLAVEQFEYWFSTASYQRTHTVPVYRPPPLDRRPARLLNCVIRI
jgi:hypothetical protein